jgi:hypothetical protein
MDWSYYSDTRIVTTTYHDAPVLAGSVRGKGDLTGMAWMAEVARRTRSAIGSGPMKGENGAVALQEPARG